MILLRITGLGATCVNTNALMAIARKGRIKL